MADEFTTVCDKWGVSGDYHEFAFGPARDKDGNFFITLNVGFGGGHQAKAPWRGWCVKVDARTARWSRAPTACARPTASTSARRRPVLLRQPGRVGGDQQDASSEAGQVLRPPGRAARGSRIRRSRARCRQGAGGMLYDGHSKGKTGRVRGAAAPVYPELDPPCIWFPYGRMGQSAASRSGTRPAASSGRSPGSASSAIRRMPCVMRVALEKVNGVYQGACFPFRSGLQCGVNRLALPRTAVCSSGRRTAAGARSAASPTASSGSSSRGSEPFEIHHIDLTQTGFDLVFTKPIDPDSLEAKPASVASFTYVYHSTYGCPETDSRFETIGRVTLSADGKTLSIPVEQLRKGRVYEIRLDGLATAEGERVLHPEAYYTLNELK